MLPSCDAHKLTSISFVRREANVLDLATVHTRVPEHAEGCRSGISQVATAESKSKGRRGEIRGYQRTCLERLILFGETSLRTAIENFVAHYQHERNHQGLSNRLIQPEMDHLGNTGAIQRRERLGGMLSYYYRTAA